MRGFFVVALCALLAVTTVRSAVDPAMECAFCTIALAMTEEVEVQVKFMNKIKEQSCGKMGSLTRQACEMALDKASAAVLGKAAPEATCAKIGMCSASFSQCKLFDAWPIKSLPDQPLSWPTERHSRELGGLPDFNAELEKFLSKIKAVVASTEQSSSSTTDAHESRFYEFAHNLASMQFSLKALLDGASLESLQAKDANGCAKFDLKCRSQSVAKHLPFSDADGDSFSTKRELRGYDWRGKDCDDDSAQIHPGRATRPEGSTDDVDWNCNGVFGANATASYEELFCSGPNAPRPLVALGDSATAHFHLPPQWFTAKGWNLDGLESTLADEMDFPACSWSTGHSTDASKCPYQDTVPGLAQGQITSLYSQMRSRNRCNTNSFTNVGVNGARMTSSSGLVDALVIDPKNDSPVLLWLSLLGNDICKSDTSYTPEDVFYTDAVATLQRLDAMLPAGSTVVSPSLFDGELLYDTMNSLTHPLGTSYKLVYDWMNCLQVSPCFGWLNSNADIRRQSTEHAKKLNDQYRKIAAQSSTLFKNISYLFYAADYQKLFADYGKSGLPVANLIEKVDGFHPSQAGNAAMAIEFFGWLEREHPEAIGAVNPFNAQLDEQFFASN